MTRHDGRHCPLRDGSNDKIGPFETSLSSFYKWRVISLVAGWFGRISRDCEQIIVTLAKEATCAAVHAGREECERQEEGSRGQGSSTGGQTVDRVGLDERDPRQMSGVVGRGRGSRWSCLMVIAGNYCTRTRRAGRSKRAHADEDRRGAWQTAALTVERQPPPVVTVAR